MYEDLKIAYIGELNDDKLAYFVCIKLLAYSGLGHPFSEIGRKIWKIVIWKYFVFSKACLGIWTDDMYHCYDMDKLIAGDSLTFISYYLVSH